MKGIQIHNSADEGFSLLGHNAAWILYMGAKVSEEFAVSLTWTRRLSSWIAFCYFLLFSSASISASSSSILTSSCLLSPPPPFLLSVLCQCIGH